MVEENKQDSTKYDWTRKKWILRNYMHWRQRNHA